MKLRFNSMVFYYSVRAFCNFLRIFVCRLKSYGLENIPKEGSFILASNHTSYLDAMAIPMVCPRRLCFLSRENLFERPILGPFLKGLGCLPIKRDGFDIRAIRVILEKLAQGTPILLYPEGTRHKEKQTIKAGIGLLAAKSGKPVIPIFVKGADDVLPPGAKWLKYGTIEVHFGPALTIQSGEDIQVFTQKVMNRIYTMVT